MGSRRNLRSADVVPAIPLLLLSPAVAESVATMSGMKYKLGPKTIKPMGGGWFRDVIFADGRVVRVGVTKGRYAAGMYGVKGYHWHGWVQDRWTYKSLLNERVPKSLGARGLLIDAGLIDAARHRRNFEANTDAFGDPIEYGKHVREPGESL